MLVRLLKIAGSDLNQFDFDYDLTWAGFFVNADGKVYGRYGGRDASGPDGAREIFLTTTEAILTTCVVISQRQKSLRRERTRRRPGAAVTGRRREQTAVRIAARRRVAIFMAVVSVDACLE